MQTYLRCPAKDADCAAVQGASFNALVLFVLVHEMAHQLLKHEITKEGVNVEQELAADRKAYAVLSKFSKELHYGRTDELNEKLRRVTRMVPVVWLYVEASREGLANVVAQAREQALLDSLNQEERDEADEMLKPDVKAEGLFTMQVK